MQSRDEREDDANHGEEAESANNVQDSLEYEETSSEDDLQSETSVSPAASDHHPNRSSKQKGKSTPKITKSTIKRPWASNARKAKDSDIDMALPKTATSLADRLLQPEQPKKRGQKKRKMKMPSTVKVWPVAQEKNYGFPFSDISGYLKNTHKNPKFGNLAIWQFASIFLRPGQQMGQLKRGIENNTV